MIKGLSKRKEHIKKKEKKTKIVNTYGFKISDNKIGNIEIKHRNICRNNLI